MSASLPFELPGFEIVGVHSNGQHVDVEAISVARSAVCPDCGELSVRIHSRYLRHPRDLPCQESTLHLHLQVQRFFCRNPACRRKTFVEPIPPVALRYAHRTNRFTRRLVQLGLALGGEAGAQLGRRIGLPISGDTILRVLHCLPPPEYPPPRVLGIDDWAWRKGVRYGTILCDLERGNVIDLLPDSEAESVVRWLKLHPGIEIVTRDRSSSYGDAISQGAPQAQQVADRWHLLKNLRDTVEQVLSGHRQCLALKDLPPSVETTAIARANPIPQPPSPKATQTQRANREKRLAGYQQVIDLHQKGMYLQDIARVVGLDPKTVSTWLAAGEFPERKPIPVGSRSLHPYLEYIHHRWDEGCHNAMQLWREIGEQGYDRGPHSIQDYCARLRQGLVLHHSEQVAVKPLIRRYSPKEATFLLTSWPERLTEQQAQNLARMREAHPVIEQTYTLAQAFLKLLGARQVDKLAPWMHEALRCSLTPFQTFATGLHRDLSAVQGALSSPWSNGRVEGHVNRLKLVKRQMYGQASFELLRTRVVYPP